MIDVTDDVLFNEENVIAVRVNNEDNADIPSGRPQQNLDFCYFGAFIEMHGLSKRIRYTLPMSCMKMKRRAAVFL